MSRRKRRDPLYSDTDQEAAKAEMKVQHDLDVAEQDRLETQIEGLKERLELADKRAQLWQDYAHGLEARVEIAKLDDAKRNKQTLGPLLQGIGGGILGAAMYGIGSSFIKESKKGL